MEKKISSTPYGNNIANINNVYNYLCSDNIYTMEWIFHEDNKVDWTMMKYKKKKIKTIGEFST